MLRHVTIHSTCLEESVKFYEEIVGLKVLRKLGDQIVFLSDEEGHTAIEIIRDTEGYEGKKLSLGFGVEDVEKFREELISKGLTVSPIISPNPMVKFFFTKDPNGVDIQFI